MRILRIIIPEDKKQEFDKLLDEDSIIEKLTTKNERNQFVYEILIEEEELKRLLTKLDDASCFHRAIIAPVEGTLPKLEKNKQKNSVKITLGRFITISKEELYIDIEKPVELTANFIFMVLLSSLVAGIGILRDNQAIIIGAMVIAPFLGPNMAMAFGTTLGDWPVIKKAVATGAVATGIALLISVLWGYFSSQIGNVPIDANIEAQDIILALVCGFAGVISVVSGQGSTLVGVMVAAALLPPLMKCGLFMGSGSYSAAMNSLLIFSTNIVCLNIAGIITFYLAGIRPSKWWEKENAMKKTRNAIFFWILALLSIIGIMIYQYYREKGMV